MDQQLQNNKKTASTDTLYQSTFMPIFQKAETQIKKIIVYYFWTGKSKAQMRMLIAKIIEETDSKIPKDLPNKEAYINGLYRSSERMITTQYDSAMLSFLSIASLIRINVPQDAQRELRRPITIESPKQLFDILKNEPKKLQLNMWAEGKASVRVQNYSKEITKFLNGMDRQTMTTSEPGKKPISLWQKAELDIRHSKQMEMLDSLKEQGVKLAYISSHPDCSKRCEKWQGHLVSLTESTGNVVTTQSPKSAFLLYKVDGHNVYSLPDITSVVDEYGYTNNIIVGFNCRHHLIPYTKGSEKPTGYDEKDVAKQRNIENKIRAMEREIRAMKEKEQSLLVIGDKKAATQLHRRIEMAIEQYKAYCNKNGYAWEQYRINIK